MTLSNVWPVSPATLLHYRNIIQADLGIPWDQLPGWCLLRALQWAWREEPTEPPLETPTQAAQVLGRRQAWHNQVSGLNCQVHRPLSRGVTHLLAYRATACGKLTCPSCSIYRQFRYCLRLLETPPGTLVFRELGWFDIAEPLPTRALQDWSRVRKFRNLHLAGWQGSCHLGDGQVSQGRRGLWWSAEAPARSNAHRLPEQQHGGGLYGDGQRLHQEALAQEVWVTWPDRRRHLTEVLTCNQYRAPREIFQSGLGRHQDSKQSILDGLRLTTNNCAFPSWDDPVWPPTERV